MFVLYEKNSGRAISQASEPFDNPNSEVYGIKETSIAVGLWDEGNRDFIPIQKARRMSTLEFMERFTDSELVGILEAAKTSAQIELFMLKMKQASFIDLSYESTVSGVNALASMGLITEQRASEVLNG